MTKKTVKQQKTSTVHKKRVDDMPTSEDLIEEGRQKGMVQGLALAIALMYKGEDERGIWRSAGLTISECIANEVAEYDMDKIVKHWKELEGIPGGNY